MRKVLAVIAVLALTGAGFGAGWWYGRSQVPPMQPRNPDTKSPDDPWQDKPRWLEWKYPDSREASSAHGGGGRAGAVSVGPLDAVVLVTPDSFEKVLAFYADKFHADILAAPNGGGSMSYFRSEHGEDEVVVGDVVSDSLREVDDGGPGGQRPVKTKMVARRTKLYDLTLVISKADGEKHTRIYLAYYPNP
jgi:hypothetical protein